MLPPKEEAQVEAETAHLFSDNCNENEDATTPTPTQTAQKLQNLELDFSKHRKETNPFLDEDLQVQVQLLGEEKSPVEVEVGVGVGVRRKFSDSSEPSSSHSGSSPCPSSPISQSESQNDQPLVILDEDENSKVEFQLEHKQQDVVSVVDAQPQPPNSEPVSTTSTQGEILAVLQNLENVKTPEPSDMPDSIVRASFVDFSVDDVGDNDDAKSQQSQVSVGGSGSGASGQPLEEESGEDEDSKEFSLSLNPDLPKIRQQQIRNWLEFERESEKSEDSNGNVNGNEDGDPRTKTLAELIKDGSGSGGDFDLDSLSSHPGDHTVTDADGLQRRVRFLSDEQGNILISVFLVNADGEDEQPQVIQVANMGGENGISNGMTIPEIIESQLGLHVTSTSTSASASTASTATTAVESKEEISEKDIKEDSDKLSAPVEEQQEDETGKKVRISGDPSLSAFDDGEDGGDGDDGSDSETMSTSSCSSMIEVIPKEKSAVDEKLLEFVKDCEWDENNNEVKSDMINLMDADPIQMNPINVIEEKPKTEEPIIVDTATTIATEKVQVGDIGDIALAASPNPSQPQEVVVSSGEVTISGSSCIQDVNGTGELLEPPVTPTLEKVKFKPTLVEIEMKSDTEVSQQQVYETRADKTPTPVQTSTPTPTGNLVSTPIAYSPAPGKAETSTSCSTEPEAMQMQMQMQMQSPIPTAPLNFDEHDMMDPEQQFMSLPISEEPISAVALTIAKWESFSKKQQQQADAGGGVIAVKGLGKLILPSYTNNCPTAAVNNQNQHQQPKNGQCLTQGKMANGHGQPPMGMGNGNGCNGINMNGNGNNAKNANKVGPTPTPWNHWPNNKVVGDKVPLSAEEEEAIYAQPNGQGGSLATNLANPSNLLRSYPKPNSRGEIINWFKEGEIHRSGILLSYGQTNHHTASQQLQQMDSSPVIVSWFFGLITRQQAEELLMGQPTGTYLVRISTRIWGYTLSYQSNNKTRHFLISAINPAVPGTLTAGSDTNGQSHKTPAPASQKQQLLFPFSPGGRYAFIGTNMTPYTTLTSLIRHHSHAPITKAGEERLLMPCPGGPKIAGIEFIFKK